MTESSSGQLSNFSSSSGLLGDDDLRTFLRRQAVKYHLKGDRQSLEDSTGFFDFLLGHKLPIDRVNRLHNPTSVGRAESHPLHTVERERVLQYKVGPQGTGCKLVQMNESHIDKCMEIQAACFEPHHCEDRQSYVDRMKIYPEGMVVLMVPTEPTDQDPSVHWEIAGYILFQPFFKGEVYYDGDTEKLEKAISTYRSQEYGASVAEDAPNANCLYTHELSISPKFRGKRLTAPLTSYVEEVAMAKGFDWLTLVSLPEPHPFWKKNGYQTHSEIDYEGAPCFYMEKRVARVA